MGNDGDDDPTMKEWSVHEEGNETDKLKEELARLRLREKPKKSCLHHLFTLISFLMGATAFLMIIGQLVGLYFYEVDPLQGVLRCYVVLMCFIVLLNELEWTAFIRESAILRMWISRGIFYSLVGILGLVEDATTESDVAHVDSSGHDQAMYFIMIVAYMMVACGALYFGLGCLFIQLLRNRVMADYERRLNPEETPDQQQKLTKEGSVV